MKKKKIIIAVAVCLAVVLGLTMFIMSFRTRKFTDVRKYLNAKGYMSGREALSDDIDSMQDFRGAVRKFLIFGGTKACSFSLSEENFDAYCSYFAEKYTSSYEQYHDMKVADIKDTNSEDDYYGFRFCDFCNDLTDKPVEDYEILYFSPASGTGGAEIGVFADPETYSIVVCKGGSN